LAVTLLLMVFACGDESGVLSEGGPHQVVSPASKSIS
jgi:hypothetical protein